MSDKPASFAELKRRNVLRAAAFYAASAWLLVQRAIMGYERALELSPNYANAPHWFGDGPLMSMGRFDRALAEGKRAVELDPFSLINNADLGWIYINARRYDEAIAQLRKTTEIDPRFYLARYYLDEALQGQLTEANAEYRTAVELDDDPLALAFLERPMRDRVKRRRRRRFSGA